MKYNLFLLASYKPTLTLIFSYSSWLSLSLTNFNMSHNWIKFISPPTRYHQDRVTFSHYKFIMSKDDTVLS